ncbi:MAG: hypothetical protein ACI4OL_06450, partial [Gemmiger sp.]
SSTVACRNGKELFDQLLKSHESFRNYQMQAFPSQNCKMDIQNQQSTYLALYNRLRCAKKAEHIR